jgi:hypothetical protein
MMKTKEVCGIDSLNLLQESILEYLSANRESSDIQTTLKDILTAFAGKQADKEISEGVLNRENKETRIQEIINNFFKEAQQDGGASVLGSDFQQALTYGNGFTICLFQRQYHWLLKEPE